MINEKILNVLGEFCGNPVCNTKPDITYIHVTKSCLIGGDGHSALFVDFDLLGDDFEKTIFLAAKKSKGLESECIIANRPAVKNYDFRPVPYETIRKDVDFDFTIECASLQSAIFQCANLLSNTHPENCYYFDIMSNVRKLKSLESITNKITLCFDGGTAARIKLVLIDKIEGELIFAPCQYKKPGK